jgi:hypothetical protein
MAADISAENKWYICVIFYERNCNNSQKYMYTIEYTSSNLKKIINEYSYFHSIGTPHIYINNEHDITDKFEYIKEDNIIDTLKRNRSKHIYSVNNNTLAIKLIYRNSKTGIPVCAAKPDIVSGDYKYPTDKSEYEIDIYRDIVENKFNLITVTNFNRIPFVNISSLPTDKIYFKSISFSNNYDYYDYDDMCSFIDYMRPYSDSLRLFIYQNEKISADTDKPIMKVVDITNFGILPIVKLRIIPKKDEIFVKSKMIDFTIPKNIDILEIHSCHTIKFIIIPDKSVSVLTDLKIKKCINFEEIIGEMPKCLQTIDIADTNLQTFPKFNSALNQFRIINCPIKHISREFLSDIAAHIRHIFNINQDEKELTTYILATIVLKLNYNFRLTDLPFLDNFKNYEEFLNEVIKY